MTSDLSYRERMAQIETLVGAERLAALRALKSEKKPLTEQIRQSILEEGLKIQESSQNTDSENLT
jgi:hypothetical protein